MLGDSAYGTGELRHHLANTGKTAVIKPPPLRPAVEGGFRLDDFDIDLDARTATCPAGMTVTITPARNAYFGARCLVCPLRRRCSTAKDGRVLHVHPHHTLLAAARAFAHSDNFDTVYRRHRPMVERTIAWLVRGTNRKLRYRGIERNRLWWSHRCAAINLQRLLNLGLTRNSTTWVIARMAGPGADKEGTTPRATKPSSAAGSHPQHQLFGRSCPGPRTRILEPHNSAVS